MALDEQVAGMVVKLAMESDGFQKQIQAINREMKVVDSAFKSTGYTAKDFGNSIDGLEANLDKCKKMLELQSKAVDMYEQRMNSAQKTLDSNIQTHIKLEEQIYEMEKALNQAKSSYDSNSQEVAELEKQLEQLRKAYEKNEQLIRNSQKALDNSTITYNNAIGKIKDFEKQIKDTEQALDSFNKESKDTENVNVRATKSVNEMNIAMGNLVAEGIERTVDAFGELIQYSFEYTEQMTKAAAQTGLVLRAYSSGMQFFK